MNSVGVGKDSHYRAQIDATVPYVATEHVSAYRYYVLGVLWIVMLLRFVDLQIVAVLLESIRAEFHVSDTQLGFLSGTAFAIFYSTLGLPIAWLADRYSRRNIVAACLAVWSGMTALCGTAGSFVSLFLARIGVGVGEAGGAPPCYSLVSDYFPANRRSTIMAILNSATPMGVFAGFIVGGYINASLGWRATLISIGLFGVVVALLVRLTVREPVRGSVDGIQAVPAAAGFVDTLQYLWRLRSYRHLVFATSIGTLGAAGSGIWIASFFIRVHEMPPVEVSTWLAFVYGGGGLVGAIVGGMLADRFSRRTGDQRWQAWLPALAMLSIFPFSFFVYTWHDPKVALLVHVGTTFLMHAWLGPAYGTVQSLAGANRRAMAAAINLLIVNLLALGLGPLLVGAMSDYFNAQFGSNSLRYSLLTLVAVTYTWAALHFALAARSLRADLKTP